MKLDKLIDGTPVEVINHPTLNVVCGVIYDLDTVNESEDYLKEMLQHEGVVNVRRIRKRVGESFKNLPLVVLSFYGTKLPDYVFFGLMRVQVRAYYPSPLLCFRCGTYGHSKKVCDPTKFQGICLRCAEQHDPNEPPPCQRDAHCKKCNGPHAVNSRDCPVYKNEERIIKIKVDQGLSFGEARSMFKSISPSYADTAKTNAEDEKDRTIAHLRKEVEVLRKIVDNLRSKDEALGKQKASSSNSIESAMQNHKNNENASIYESCSTNITGNKNGNNYNGKNKSKKNHGNNNKVSDTINEHSKSENTMEIDTFNNKRKPNQISSSPSTSPNRKKSTSTQNQADPFSCISPTMFSDLSNESL